MLKFLWANSPISHEDFSHSIQNATNDPLNPLYFNELQNIIYSQSGSVQVEFKTIRTFFLAERRTAVARLGAGDISGVSVAIFRDPFCREINFDRQRSVKRKRRIGVADFSSQSQYVGAGQYRRRLAAHYFQRLGIVCGVLVALHDARGYSARTAGSFQPQTSCQWLGH